MQGFIINMQRVRDEDMVVTLITPTHVESLYRFYGARHSVINIGYKIDFEIESNVKTTISRLRNIWHMGYPWLSNREHLHIWQRFIQLFVPHLRDSSEIDDFYFNLLDDTASKWHIQNPKRLVVEAYVKLLHFEGRLFRQDSCFLCERPLSEPITLVRAYLPVHVACAHRPSFDTVALEKLFSSANSMLFDDEAIQRLYDIVLEGL